MLFVFASDADDLFVHLPVGVFVLSRFVTMAFSQMDVLSCAVCYKILSIRILCIWAFVHFVSLHFVHLGVCVISHVIVLQLHPLGLKCGKVSRVGQFALCLFTRFVHFVNLYFSHLGICVISPVMFLPF